MLHRLFPSCPDDDFRGPRLAIWLFALVTCWRIGVALLHVIAADGGAQSIARLPLDTYPPGAAQNVVALFAHLGVEQLAFGLLSLVALVRWRALLPFLYALLLADALVGRLVASAKPLARAGPSGAATPLLILTAITAIGFVLSLLGDRTDARTRRT